MRTYVLYLYVGLYVRNLKLNESFVTHNLDFLKKYLRIRQILDLSHFNALPTIVPLIGHNTTILTLRKLL